MVFWLRILVFFATDTPGDFSPSCCKHPLLKLQTRSETSQPPRQTHQLFVTTNAARICLTVSFKTPNFVATDTVGDVPTSLQKCHVCIPTNTVSS